MPHDVEFNFVLKVNSGPNVSPKKRTLKVETYTPHSNWIENDKNSHVVKVRPGPKKNLRFLVIDASTFGNDACPRNGSGLFMMFQDDPGWVRLDGPLVYMGPTLALLPDKDAFDVTFRNTLHERVEVTMVYGGSETDAAKPEAIPAQPAPAEAS